MLLMIVGAIGVKSRFQFLTMASSTTQVAHDVEDFYFVTVFCLDDLGEFFEQPLSVVVSSRVAGDFLIHCPGAVWRAGRSPFLLKDP